MSIWVENAPRAPETVSSKWPPVENRLAAWAPCLVLIILAIAAFFAFLTGARGAQADAALRAVAPGEMKSGSLLLKRGDADGGGYVEAPRLGADFDIAVSGPTARARVTQLFHNPTAGWIEAVYVYPLPDGGAVDTLRMVVGDRVVVGDIKERSQAKIVYEQAKASGRKAALIEQERPNIFTNSVANIGPGETVVVQIEYQEPVRQSGETFSLRVPLVVAPRYNPAPVVQTVDFNPDGRGWGQVSDSVPDRARIERKVLDPRVSAPVNPVTISVHLAAGFPLGEVRSHHHAVTTETVSGDTRVIRLAEGPVPADRDFQLTWTEARAKTPAVGLFRERVGDADYLVAFVTPPAVKPAEERRQREIVFVIDNSGSMGGTSIVQAKASLVYALGRLKPTDRFNVIRFDDTMDKLFADTVPADAEHVGRARRFVEALQAKGGTEMLPPMRAALTDARGSGAQSLRQVVFLTDGEIGNERQLLDTIGDMRGRSRLFMVGIGSAPNTFLMTRAAEIGRGTFTHIGTVEQVESRMRTLFDKLESPVVTNLAAGFSGTRGDVTPGLLPDLYRGEPIVLAARLSALAGDLTIKGMIGAQPWQVTLPVKDAAEGKGISKLWARRKITDAEIARTLGQATPEETDARVLALGLDHHLVTRLTSLVAVDKTPSRPDGARLTRADLPLNLPAGWDFDKVFGERTPPSAPELRERHADASDALAHKAADRGAVVRAMSPRPTVAPTQTVTLPRTATDAELRMLLGAMLLAASLVVTLLRRRAGRAGLATGR